MLATKEQGVVHILLLGIVVIALVIGLVVAIVLSFDSLHRKESSESLFDKDSKISQIRERVRSKKEELISIIHHEVNEAGYSSEDFPADEAEERLAYPNRLSDSDRASDSDLFAEPDRAAGGR